MKSEEYLLKEVRALARIYYALKCRQSMADCTREQAGEDAAEDIQRGFDEAISALERVQLRMLLSMGSAWHLEQLESDPELAELIKQG